MTQWFDNDQKVLANVVHANGLGFTLFVSVNLMMKFIYTSCKCKCRHKTCKCKYKTM